MAAVPSVSVKLLHVTEFFWRCIPKIQRSLWQRLEDHGGPVSSVPHKGPGNPRCCLMTTQVLTEDAWQDERRFKVTTGEHGSEYLFKPWLLFLGFSEQMCFLPPSFAQISVILVTNSNNISSNQFKSSNIHPFIIVFDHFSGSQEL